MQRKIWNQEFGERRDAFCLMNKWSLKVLQKLCARGDFGGATSGPIQIRRAEAQFDQYGKNFVTKLL